MVHKRDRTKLPIVGVMEKSPYWLKVIAPERQREGRSSETRGN